MEGRKETQGGKRKNQRKIHVLVQAKDLGCCTVLF
jgi:hypothetical protein